jgi:hypothetical protein
LPEQQTDRSRFGEGHSYYDAGKHTAKRKHEAKLMIETFGDLARMTLPPELIKDQRVDPLFHGPSWRERDQEMRDAEGLKVKNWERELMTATHVGGTE